MSSQGQFASQGLNQAVSKLCGGLAFIMKESPSVVNSLSYLLAGCLVSLRLQDNTVCTERTTMGFHGWKPMKQECAAVDQLASSVARCGSEPAQLPM